MKRIYIRRNVRDVPCNAPSGYVKRSTVVNYERGEAIESALRQRETRAILFAIETPPRLVLPHRLHYKRYILYTIYTRNGNQYCPIAIMLHRNCRYTMQLSTTRRTCQERNEGDQWIFNCRRGTDSRAPGLRNNARALYNWPARYFPRARTYYGSHTHTHTHHRVAFAAHALMRYAELTID